MTLKSLGPQSLMVPLLIGFMKALTQYQCVKHIYKEHTESMLINIRIYFLTETLLQNLQWIYLRN